MTVPDCGGATFICLPLWSAVAKRWRPPLCRQRAREDGVPAYVVLHDATLQELAARKPGSEAELAGVKGLGPAKLARYGVELLDVLAG